MCLIRHVSPSCWWSQWPIWDEFAKNFQMSRIKITYLINFAIARYFMEILVDELTCCDDYSISFDESLNETTQTCQMGVHVRYWSKSENQTCVRYLDSKVMGHTTANDLLTNIIGAINNVDDGNHMIQVFMYEPPTNWKFFEMLQKDRLEKEQHELFDIGSCSLYNIYGAFKTGGKSSGWNIIAIIKGVFTISHDTPARGEDYIAIAGGERFPLFFCATRWVEDTIVADRLIEIWDSIIKIIRYWEKVPISDRLYSKSFLNTQQAVSDPFSVAKFQFFSFVGSLFKPFLTKYQTSYPMLPMLTSMLTCMMT